MYPYLKKAPLMDLKATGSDDRLEFTTPTERAVIYLNADGSVQKTVHTDLKNNKENVIPHEGCHHVVVGESNWTRDVYHYLKPNDQSHLTLRLGLTVHRGEGTWSSLPHDFENHLESGFEEVFFHILHGGPQKAIQVGRGVWADGKEVDEVWPVANRTFSVIPMGYHPVVGEPKVKVTYVWAYLAKKKSWEKI